MLLNLNVSHMYIVEMKSKKVSLEISVNISGKIYFIRCQNSNIVITCEPIFRKERKLYQINEKFGIAFDSLSKHDTRLLDTHFEKKNEDVSIRTAGYVAESSIPRYSYVKDDDYDFIKNGIRFYSKGKLEKLRSKDAWLTQFGRVVKVSCPLTLE